MHKYKKCYFYHIFVAAWGNNAKCCMDVKRIRCLQIVSQHVPIYYNRLRDIGGIGNTRRAVLATATFIGDCEMRICVSKLWTVLAYSCKRAASSVHKNHMLCCRLLPWPTGYIRQWSVDHRLPWVQLTAYVFCDADSAQSVNWNAVAAVSGAADSTL